MLLWVTPGFAAHEEDTVCIPPMQLLAKELHRREVPLAIIALEYPYSAEPYHWHGIPVFPCNGQNRRWLRWRTHARARRFAQKINQEKPLSGIHSFWLGQAWALGKSWASSWQLPHSTTLMGQDVLLANNARYLRRLCDGRRVVALTDFHAQTLQEQAGVVPSVVIPWGMEQLSVVPTDGFRPSDVLGVGSLLPVKNWEKWLQTVAEIQKEMPQLRAVLVGDGPERLRLHAHARELGLENTVLFKGTLSRPEVLELMRQSKVLLHTAHFESFGFVLTEAAAAGCAVVGTPVGILPELGVTGENISELKTLTINAIKKPSAPELGERLLISGTADAYLRFWHDIGSIPSVSV
jgi:1,2-diacylglycerol 3-alpha-glucosyltransferase